MPISDASYMLRGTADGALSASEQSATGVHVGPGPLHGMKARLYVPSYSGTTPTLDVKIQECDTLGGTYTDVPGAAFAQIGEASGTYEIHFHWTKRYLRRHITLGGTTPNYGITTLGLTPGQIPTT